MSPESGESIYKIGVQEALETGRLGFDEISVEGTEQLFQLAEQGKVFTVPDETHAAAYAERAGSLGRGDLQFTVEA